MACLGVLLEGSGLAGRATALGMWHRLCCMLRRPVASGQASPEPGVCSRRGRRGAFPGCGKGVATLSVLVLASKHACLNGVGVKCLEAGAYVFPPWM